MKKQLEPANITLMERGKKPLNLLLPVESLDMYDNTGDFHPRGLYSTEIFGRLGDKTRMTNRSYIDMKTTVFHPKYFEDLTGLKKLYGGIMAGTAYAVFDDELNDFVKADILDGSTGYSFFMTHYPKLVFERNRSSRRNLRIDFLERFRGKEDYRYLPVIPAGMRDVEIDENGRTTEDDINPLYRKALRIANTIVFNEKNLNDPINDNSRWQMQSTVNEIYTHILGILKGKRGFLYKKWADRSIVHGTRNVLTGLDPAVKCVGGVGAAGVNDTTFGLLQVMKGTLYKSIFLIKNGPAKQLIDSIPAMVPVVDPKTRLQTLVELDKRELERWGTEEGIEGLINDYAIEANRHEPVMINGTHYLALIYRDKKSFKVIYDVRDLPDHIDANKVRPITWSELLYISVKPLEQEAAVFPTRYPVTGTGSIYASNVRIRTTLRAEPLVELGANWRPLGRKYIYPQMPIMDGKFFDSMSVHISKTEGLNADFDGDKCSANFVYGKEAVKSCQDYLKSKEAFLSPGGSLNYGLSSGPEVNVLKSFTGGLNKRG